jgi:hypothetical protein
MPNKPPIVKAIKDIGLPNTLGGAGAGEHSFIWQTLLHQLQFAFIHVHEFVYCVGSVQLVRFSI